MVVYCDYSLSLMIPPFLAKNHTFVTRHNLHFASILISLRQTSRQTDRQTTKTDAVISVVSGHSNARQRSSAKRERETSKSSGQ